MSSAVELGIFDSLEEDGNRPKSLQEVCQASKMNCLRPQDFMDALVSMGHIAKNEDGKYSNTPEGSHFLVSKSPYYIGVILHFRGKVKDSDFGNLTTYLKGGEIKPFAKDFSEFYDGVPGSNKYFADYM